MSILANFMIQTQKLKINLILWMNRSYLDTKKDNNKKHSNLPNITKSKLVVWTAPMPRTILPKLYSKALIT